MKAKILVLGGVAIAVALIPLVFPASSVRAELEPDCAANPMVLMDSYQSRT